MQKQTPLWVIGDPLSVAKVNSINTDLDTLFEELSNEDLVLTYDIQGQLTSIVDNENSITINIDWSEWSAPVVKLKIQKVGDPNKRTITYDGQGFPSTIIYA